MNKKEEETACSIGFVLLYYKSKENLPGKGHGKEKLERWESMKK